MKTSNDLPDKNRPLIKSTNQFPVVGIGASAGGLDAFKKIIKAIPENSGMAFVLVQHLDPDHESLLPELLQKVTTIPVVEITDNIEVHPNHVYIIPSNKMMVANDGVLQLSSRSVDKNERNLPINLFFTSLAEVHESRSIGIVLSGTAFDGTKGLKAIKEYGGITFAQDEASAEHEGMPNSAVTAGVVDFILPPEKMPEKLIELTKIINGASAPGHDIQPQDEDVFRQMLALLRLRKGTDFTYYKQTTVRRRILRRMAIHKIEEPAGYYTYLKESKPEQDTLFQDLLIPVTSFFRDPKTFDSLCQNVFPGLLRNQVSGTSIRLWIAGCSTGQEAYSIAICLKEFLGDRPEKVQIFATDLSEPAIARARSGIYTKIEVEDLSSQRLEEFFSKVNGGYQLKKSIREMCVFAVHNFLKDPPFGKMDFISCRNVLIYMEPYLQKKALTTFHYALNKNGFLLLGQSETISSVPELFTAAMKQDKIFTPRDVPGRFMNVATHRKEQSLANTEVAIAANGEHAVRMDYQKTADDIMLSRYTPAGVVVDEAMNIVHFRGKTANYLEQLPGKPSHNLLKMAREGLAFELRNILHKAKKSKAPVIKDNIPIGGKGSPHYIALEAIRLPETIEPYYLVLFHDNLAGNGFRPGAEGSAPQKSTGKIKDDKDARIAQLEKELAQTREDMRSITEDQEAVNEELQSANEELLSGSEELQSLNEEMESSKEELQSTNEELTIVNQEIIALNEQVTEARNFAEAIIATIREPLLVLDKNMRVKSANSAFYRTFRINEADTEGKLIYELGNRQWNIPSLRTLLDNILPEKSMFADFEVSLNFPNIGERIMVLNASEMQSDNVGEKLILLAVEDVTEKAAAFKKIEESNRRYHMMLMHSPFAFSIMKGKDMEITLANDLMKDFWGKGQDIEGKMLLQLLPELADQPFPGMIRSVFATGKPVNANEILARIDYDGHLKDRYFDIVYQPHLEADETISGVISIAHEVTNQVLARKRIEESEHRYHNMVYSSPSMIAILKGEDLIIEIANNAILEAWGKGADVVGKPLLKVLPELVEQGLGDIFLSVFKTGITFNAYEKPIYLLRNGKREQGFYTFIYQAQRNVAGEIDGVAIIAHEVTSQAELNLKIRESEERFRSLTDQVPMMAFVIEPNEKATVSYWNKTWLDYTGQTTEEALGRAWDGILHSDDVPGVQDIYAEAFTNRTPYFIPAVRVRRHDGVFRYHMFKGNPRYLEDGEFVGYIGVGIDVHEQKLAEESVKESEQRFRNLVEKAPSPICILKGENMVLEVANDPLYEAWGVDNEALGKPLLEIIPEIEDQPFVKWLSDVYQKGITHYGSEEPAFFHGANGVTRIAYFNFVYQPYRENDGSISGVMVLASDVSEQVVARKKMQAQADMVQQLLLSAPAFICTLIGPKHVYGLINERYQKLFGKRQLQGLPIMEALPELAGQGFDTLLDKIYNTGETYTGIDVPVTVSRDEGLEPVVSYFNFSYQPMYDENKEIFSILLFGYEVTDQVLAKNKNLEDQKIFARELEEKVKQRTLELSEANEELQKKNQLIALSKYNKRFLTEFSDKFSAHKLHNEFFNSLVQFIADTTNLDYVFVGKLEQNDNHHLAIQTIALTAFGKFSDNIRYPLPDGPCEQIIQGTLYSYPRECMKTFPYNETIRQFEVEGYLGYPLYDDLGKAIGLIAVMHRKEIDDPENVSSVLKIVARRAEMEMERIRQDELLVQNNKMLEQNNDELAKMNQELQAFNYVSSHDLQEPLRKIRTFSKLLLEKENQNLSKDGKDYLARMRQAANRMQTLIEDLLAYSQTNTADRKFENIHLGTIVDEVKNELNDIIRTRNVIVETGGLHEAYIIPFQFRQLFNNLISNSIKFSRPDVPPHIIIKSRIASGSTFSGENSDIPAGKLSGGQQYTNITVSDNGIGFSSDYKDRIFEVFQRLHNKEEYEGTGIGLSIVKKIVENHNGFINATGDLQKGATFNIYIPTYENV